MIRVPTLVFHHADDACWGCRPDEAKNIAGATGNPCEPMHHHGFVGMRDEAVDLIAAWIIKPTE